MITLVLKQDVKGLGKKGDVVTVKPGYANNYLLPKGLAIKASHKDLELFEKQKALLHKSIQEQDKLFAQIDDVIQAAIKKRGLMIRRTANNKGVLYDKVDKKELHDELMRIVPELQYFHVEVKLDEPLDKIGKHPVDIDMKMQNRVKSVTIIVDVIDASLTPRLKYSEMKQKLAKNKK